MNQTTQAEATMQRYAILANSGYRYDFVLEIPASSVKAARDWFKREYAGDSRTKDFRVSLRSY